MEITFFSVLDKLNDCELTRIILTIFKLYRWMNECWILNMNQVVNRWTSFNDLSLYLIDQMFQFCWSIEIFQILSNQQNFQLNTRWYLRWQMNHVVYDARQMLIVVQLGCHCWGTEILMIDIFFSLAVLHKNRSRQNKIYMPIDGYVCLARVWSEM